MKRYMLSSTGMEQHKGGPWVVYDDAQAEMAKEVADAICKESRARDARIAELTSRLEHGYCPRCNRVCDHSRKEPTP
jgi:RNA polymerase-binding transcription factor DksA